MPTYGYLPVEADREVEVRECAERHTRAIRQCLGDPLAPVDMMVIGADVALWYRERPAPGAPVNETLRRLSGGAWQVRGAVLLLRASARDEWVSLHADDVPALAQTLRADLERRAQHQRWAAAAEEEEMS